jgi:hypothetical protein
LGYKRVEPGDHSYQYQQSAYRAAHSKCLVALNRLARKTKPTHKDWDGKRILHALIRNAFTPTKALENVYAYWNQFLMDEDEHSSQRVEAKVELYIIICHPNCPDWIKQEMFGFDWDQ